MKYIYASVVAAILVVFLGCQTDIKTADPREMENISSGSGKTLFTVIFDPSDGVYPDGETGIREFEADGQIKFPAAPVLEGYTLAGWYETRLAPLDWDEAVPPAGRISANKKITANIAVYALWKVIPADSYSITFVQCEGGDVLYNGFVYPRNYYQWVGAFPSAGTRAHYNSDGFWWTEPDGGEKLTTSMRIMENIIVYAHWEPEKYNLYYWTNDTRGIWSSSILTYPVDNVPLPLSPSRRGYAFQGWYTVRLDDLRHNLQYNDPIPQDNKFTPQSPVDSDIHIYALWKQVPADAYTVTFLAYDNYQVACETALFSDGYLMQATPPAVPARNHYTCDGKWYMSNGQEFTAAVMLSGDIVVTPQWTGNTYTVKFMENNIDSGVWQTRSITYPSNTLQGRFPVGEPSRAHWTAADEYWWKVKYGSAPDDRFTESTEITGDIEVYKHWIGNTYTVRYWGFSDSSPQTAVELLPACTVTYPVNTLTPPTAQLPAAHEVTSRKHYTFDGAWRTSAGSVWNSARTVIADTNLYAQWSANTYTVSFDLKGGSGTGGTRTSTYPAASVSMPASPSKSGFIFAGWIYNTSSGSRYFDGNLSDLYEKNALCTDTPSIVIEAKWVPSSGGSGILNDYDSSAANTNHELTHGGVYDDDFVVGSGAYSGPPETRAFAEELMAKLSQAAVLRQGVQQSQTVTVEGGTQTVTVTVYDYAAINMIKQQIEDMLASPSFASARGAFAATEHTINYTGGRQSVTVLNSGVYEIELWGASGGHIWSKNSKTALGGKGGWTKGRIRLNAGDVLKFYVGQEGFGTAVYNGSSFSKITNFSAEGSGATYMGGHKGGWNGGGKGGLSYSGDYAGGSGGGGATDVRYVGTYSANKNDAGEYSQRIMVAAGGGGAAQSASYNNGWPGLAGGDAGANGIRKGNIQTGGARAGGSAAQTAAAFSDGSVTSGSQVGIGGAGANGNSVAYEGPGGGGGGYYGGESIATLRGTEYTSSGAGGSSYTGGVFEPSNRDSGLNLSFGNGKAVIRYVGQ
ncbi:MAG: InlB B-repeat-containing protein [Spirochaetaceae bacterium]|nr:InlB B-repeat-containing protein [Spirochaetaceae bacterium]